CRFGFSSCLVLGHGTDAAVVPHYTQRNLPQRRPIYIILLVASIFLSWAQTQRCEHPMWTYVSFRKSNRYIVSV
ncbi:hypothetical protein EV702DRAFT_1063689, partial [Suillus placidus]